MSFVKEAWYCAGFSSDLDSGQLYAITMLAEPLVLFRTAAGVVALHDRCPHRFAPMIEAVQSRMGGPDLWARQPLLWFAKE